MKLTITIIETPDGNVDCKCEGEEFVSPLEAMFAQAASEGAMIAINMAAEKIKAGVKTVKDETRIIPIGRG